MIGTKKYLQTKIKTETDDGYTEYMCYDFCNQYYKFVCIEKCRLSPSFIKIPIIANIVSDYIHNNMIIVDEE
jgi:hypothetical protein